MRTRLIRNIVLWVLLASTSVGCNISSSRLKVPFSGVAKKVDPAKVYAEAYADQNENLTDKIRKDSSFASSDYVNHESQSNRRNSQNSRGGSSSNSCGHSH